MNYKQKHDLLSQQVRKLLRSLPEDSFAIPQLEQTLKMHELLAQTLSNPKHSVAFIGAVGVGKTTALCHLLGLVDEKNTPLLTVSSGRTTICEVEIINGKHYQVNIEPYPKTEVYNYLKDYALYLFEKAKTNNETDINNDNEEGFKLSSEIERALRNMVDLAPVTKVVEGKKTRIIKAKEFAKQFNDFEDLYSELIVRLNLKERNKTIFKPYEDNTKKWLKNTFRNINHGKFTNVSLPKKITIKVPYDIFKTKDFQIDVIDTKGIDQTVVRTDLENVTQDPKTLCILCSRFEDAPSKAITELIQQVKDSGIPNKRIEEEFIILILDRVDEAENIDDGDGPVEEKELGRQIREAQVAEDLKHKFGLSNIKICLYNAKEDLPDQTIDHITSSIKDIQLLREKEFKNVSDTIHILSKESKGGTLSGSRKQLKASLEVWLKEANGHSPVLNKYYLNALNAMDNKYASSVRASINRKGEWPNYNIYQELAVSARREVVSQLSKHISDLSTLLNNMSKRSDLEPIHVLIKQLQNQTESWVYEIYQTAFDMGRDCCDKELYHSDTLWDALYNEWGQGTGYKYRIKDHLNAWFEYDNRYKRFDHEVSTTTSQKWNDFLRNVEELIYVN